MLEKSFTLFCLLIFLFCFGVFGFAYVYNFFPSKKRIWLIEYFKSKFNHKGVIFYKTHIPVLRIKLHELMVLVARYSFLRVHLTHAVFLFLILVKSRLSSINRKQIKAGRILIFDITLDADQYVLINLLMLKQKL